MLVAKLLVNQDNEMSRELLRKIFIGNRYSKNDKNKGQNGQNRVRDWKERERSKSKTSVVTKSGQLPVNTAKQSSPRAAASISTARPVNTVAPKPKVTMYYCWAKSSKLVMLWIWGILLSPQHAGFGDQQEMLLTIPPKTGNPQYTLQDQGIFDSGCSRHMTGNKSFLTDYQEIDGGFVAFGGSPKGGKITRKGKIRTGKLDFEDVYFVKELKFNLFSVSQMCDKKNSVLFTKTECLVLSPDFKLLDESQVLLKVLESTTCRV
ncbi:hypothetical protein Tco_1069919 [Tanacetum coccineum]|uniref:Retrovirus-related Pol polyprotein from transposon TNT 1-94-like beta-barrel domain-containing protein n=1 Tax=Tanacetum coccineum TaxID=301880 RepID=A0ABQ5HJY8_9ASTR